MPSTEYPVVLVDGACKLCNGAVNVIIDRDPKGLFRFASLQSQLGQSLLREHGLSVAEGAPETVVLLENGHAYTHSTAALRIAKRLAGPWFLLWAFVLVPRPLRDAVYRWIARNRYRWFGQEEFCRMPTPALRKRLLEGS